ncbi:dehydrogenase [Haloprofundus marisrubri]|uniref:Dehydrogenase n=1 Tax=Haloprofundus marisrubri TaxID=1514971 RepID=A0A0W1RB06_9EURY|nr:2-oxo acid dehydrogenase subunit E2 [Haloprofundus marisrubri]KTG10277.1 dehydrogenase [Haloprofundus marisrubri]
MTDSEEQVVRFSPRRRGTVDYMRMAGRRSNIHGLVEVDVTEARRRIRRIEEQTGERLSFTAFLTFCLAATLDDEPTLQAYRDWRGRVHVFDDVDVNVLVETSVDGDPIGVPHVVKAANRRSLRSVHNEIRSVQQSPDFARQSRMESAFFGLPGVIRRQMWRLPQLSPRRWKNLAGTVAVTSVGMFGTGGGWGVSPTNYTLQLTVGGIATKPALVDGELATREYLSLTVTFDHDVVDGAPAARFVDRLRERIESAHGLGAPEER